MISPDSPGGVSPFAVISGIFPFVSILTTAGWTFFATSAKESESACGEAVEVIFVGVFWALKPNGASTNKNNVNPAYRRSNCNRLPMPDIQNLPKSKMPQYV